MEWSDIPDMLTVREALQRRASIKAQIELVNFDYSLAAAQVGLQKPRNPDARIAGIDEESAGILIPLQRRIVELRGELSRVEEEITFLQYHKDIFKALAYKERY